MSGRAVWKFPVSIDPLAVQFTQSIAIPAGARFLHAAAQGYAVALWYEVDPDAETEDHGFQVYGTGTGPIGDHLTYVGTGVFAEGSLVLHVYEVTGQVQT